MELLLVRTSKFESTGESRHVLGVNLALDLTKPRQILTPHVLERRIEQRVVHVHRRVRHVLPFRDSRAVYHRRMFEHDTADRVVHLTIGPAILDQDREEWLRAVRRPGRIGSVSEDGASDLLDDGVDGQG